MKTRLLRRIRRELRTVMFVQHRADRELVVYINFRRVDSYSFGFDMCNADYYFDKCIKDAKREYVRMRLNRLHSKRVLSEHRRNPFC